MDTEEDVEMPEAIAEERMGWKRTEDGLLLVPEENQEAILREHHDSMVAGLWGAGRTREFISRNYSCHGPFPIGIGLRGVFRACLSGFTL